LPSRLAPLAVILVLAGIVLATGWYRELSLETLVRHRAALDALVTEHRVLALLLYASLYIAVSALAVPGAAILTIAGGALFGVIPATLATIIGATTGATLVFLVAKTAIGDFLLRRAGPLAARIGEGFRADAFSYLLFLRLVPFPFWLINLAPALFDIPLRTFVAATVLGIIPGTFAFAFFGSGLSSAIGAHEAAYQACISAGRSDCSLEFDASHAVTPHLVAAIVILCFAALLPVALKKLRARAKPS
jgi:uncharacterized membrane protein YdjX (TVP38/TMEM64 family)